MESRKHNRTISPEESAELQNLVFDLVRERLLKAVGAGGMWTLQFRADTDTDSLFGETISEYIARDIADQIAATASDGVNSSAELAEVDADDDIQTVDDEKITIENTEWIAASTPAEAEVQPVVEVTVEFVEAVAAVEAVEYDEHRMFKPRKAA